MSDQTYYQVTISYHQGIFGHFDTYKMSINEIFTRDFGNNVGHETLQLHTGDHVLHIEASGSKEVEQDLPFSVKNDMQIEIHYSNLHGKFHLKLSQ
jgi:hypothetical protein